MLKEGDKAPGIDLPAHGGGRFALCDHLGYAVVVYFYPKDDTSGCTLQAVDFSARLGEFEEVDTRVVGISPDSPDSHDKFRAKHGLALTLASDVEKDVVSRYGVWGEKSMYGRKYQVYGRGAFDVPDRPQGSDRQDLAEREGPGPCRRGARHGASDRLDDRLRVPRGRPPRDCNNPLTVIGHSRESLT